MSLLLALTLRGSLAYLFVEGADRLAARFTPGQGHLHRRLGWLMAALVFLVPFHAFRLPPLSGWGLGAAGLWAAGALAVLGTAAVQTVRARRRWARVRLCTDSRLLSLLEDTKAEIGATAPIGLVVSGDVPAPALLGWLRPRILLPASLAAALPPERLRAIFLHELAHFRLLDLPANLLFAVVRAVHWFNPLAWLAARSWARYREECADALALQRLGGDALYGETLLETLRHASAPVPYGAVGMGESLRNLKWRLTMIGRTRTPRTGSWSWWAFLAFALPYFIAALPLPGQTGAPVPDDAAAKKEAVAAMLPWLALEDKGDPGAAWDQASQAFRGAAGRDKWIALSGSVRPPLGKCLDRTLASAIRQIDPPTAKGDYVIAQFDTSFENLKYAVETVCFQREADGTWRSAGYFIKPKS